MKIVITGGHLTPALALIEELTSHPELATGHEQSRMVSGSADIHFFGRKYATEGSSNLSAEYKVINSGNIKFYSITAGRIQRKFTIHTITALLKLPLGFIQSLIYIAKVKPDLIVTFGGYLSTPAVFCGWLLGIDSVIHEQAQIPGLANRINSLFAKQIFISWPNSQKYFPGDKTQLIGNLMRRSITNTKAKDPKIKSFISKSKNLIYVTGGNQGSHEINQLVLNNLEKFKNFEIIHQVGTTNFEGDFDQAKKVKQSNYFPVEYIDTRDIGAVLNKSKLVISRSGANIVWELAALAKPSILIPLPIAASGEQQANAQILKDAGSAIVINQKDLTIQELMESIRRITDNYNKYQKSTQLLQKTLPQNAAAVMAKYIRENFDQ